MEKAFGDWTEWGFTFVRIPDSLVSIPLAALWSAWLFFHWKREQKKSL